MEPKKLIYLNLAVLFGIMLGLLIKLWFEVVYISLLDYSTRATRLHYGWAESYPLLTLWCMGLGGAWGYERGRRWWQYIYVDKRWAGLYSTMLKRVRNS